MLQQVPVCQTSFKSSKFLRRILKKVMAKGRIKFPNDMAARVKFASDRTCCICRERGKRFQIHHIDGDPGNNEFENLVVLCLEDHDRTQSKGGFGRKLDADEIIQYRDDWI